MYHLHHISLQNLLDTLKEDLPPISVTHDSNPITLTLQNYGIKYSAHEYLSQLLSICQSLIQEGIPKDTRIKNLNEYHFTDYIHWILETYKVSSHQLFNYYKLCHSTIA